MTANSEFPRVDAFGKLHSLLTKMKAERTESLSNEEMHSTPAANPRTGIMPFPLAVQSPTQLSIYRETHGYAKRTLDETRRKLQTRETTTEPSEPSEPSKPSEPSEPHQGETCAFCLRGIYDFMHYDMHECSRCHKRFHQHCYQDFLRDNENNLKGFKHFPPCPMCRYKGNFKRMYSQSGQAFIVDRKDNNRKRKRFMDNGAVLFYEGPSGKERPVYRLEADGRGFFYDETGTTLIRDNTSTNKNL
jgi:hypothetical protein